MTTEMIGFLSVVIAVVGVGVVLAVLVLRLHTVSEKRSDDAHEAIGRNIDGVKSNLSDLKKDVVELKTDVVEIKKDVVGLKKDVVGLKTDVVEIKKDVVELKVQSAKNSTDLGWIKHYLGKEKL